MPTWFKGRKVKNTDLVVLAKDEVAQQRASSIDPNGSSPIHMGIAQQIASLGANQTFEIKHSATPHDATIRFSKSSHPPMVRPMNDGPTWDDFNELQNQIQQLRREQPVVRPHRTKYESSKEYIGEPVGPTLINGRAGFVFCDAMGRHQGYYITAEGLQYACEIK